MSKRKAHEMFGRLAEELGGVMPATRWVMRKKKKLSKKKSGTTVARLTKQLPFQAHKSCTFLYTYGYAITASAVIETMNIACNDMYDLDRTGTGKLGNKQPLFYDVLLSSSGPYKVFAVPKWRTTWTIINSTNTAVRAFVHPALGATAEFDSLAEAENFPGATIRDLTPAGGSEDKITITVTGSISDVNYYDNKDSNLLGTYGSSPSTIVYGALVLASGDGTTALNVYVSIKHEFYAELQYEDAIVS